MPLFRCVQKDQFCPLQMTCIWSVPLLIVERNPALDTQPSTTQSTLKPFPALVHTLDLSCKHIQPCVEAKHDRKTKALSWTSNVWIMLWMWNLCMSCCLWVDLKALTASTCLLCRRKPPRLMLLASPHSHTYVITPILHHRVYHSDTI